jgi:hypothetical protein
MDREVAKVSTGMMTSRGWIGVLETTGPDGEGTRRLLETAGFLVRQVTELRSLPPAPRALPRGVVVIDFGFWFAFINSGAWSH